MMRHSMNRVVLFLLIAGGSLLGMPAAYAGPPPGTVTVSIEPAAQIVNVGDSVSVDVVLDTMSNSVGGGGVFVDYDQARLTFVNGTLGGSWNQFLAGPNSNGDIISLSVGRSGGVVGAAVLVATFNFTATAFGPAPLDFLFVSGMQETSFTDTSFNPYTTLGVDGAITIVTPTETPTQTPTGTPTESPTPLPTSTPTSSQTPTSTPTETNTPLPTATPSETPTITSTFTPSSTPTLTSTPTETATFTASSTPTETPTVTPTVTPSTTPTTTATPTVTPTRTPTSTPTPRSPVITGGATVGSERIFCVASPNIGAPNIEVYSAGPNGIVENGGGDDELLGTGSTNAFGECRNGGMPGIPLSRPLVAGEVVFVLDTVNDLIGQAIVRLEAIAPVVSTLGMIFLVAMLALVSVVMLRNRREQREVPRV